MGEFMLNHLEETRTVVGIILVLFGLGFVALIIVAICKGWTGEGSSNGSSESDQTVDTGITFESDGGMHIGGFHYGGTKIGNTTYGGTHVGGIHIGVGSDHEVGSIKIGGDRED